MRVSIVGGVFFLALTAAPFSALSQERWQPGVPMFFPRHQTISAEVNGKIYTISGSAPIAQATNVVQEFDPATGKWTDRAPMPGVATHAGIAVVGGKIYVIGGFAGNPHTGPKGQNLEYDPVADSWRARKPLPRPRGSFAVAEANGKIHVIAGGVGETRTGAHDIYDPVTDTWSQGAELPVPRDHVGGASVGGLVYVFGGRTAQYDSSGRLDIYDPKTDSWREGPALPTPRGTGGSFVAGNLIGWAGGECRPERHDTAFDEVEAYDVSKNAWIKLPSLPHGVNAPSAAVVGNIVYMIGGGVEGCGSANPRHMKEVYTLSLR